MLLQPKKKEEMVIIMFNLDILKPNSSSTLNNMLNNSSNTVSKLMLKDISSSTHNNMLNHNSNTTSSNTNNLQWTALQMLIWIKFLLLINKNQALTYAQPLDQLTKSYT
jgi:hypothetical protein